MKPILKSFQELSTEELYQIIQLRVDVFVVEQESIYSDLDDKDQSSLHMFYKANDKIIGYLRILPPGLAFETYAIGRVCIHEEARKSGLGRKILLDALAHLDQEIKAQKITISAQEYLIDFYKTLDFKQITPVYIEEDGIPHAEMVRVISVFPV